MYTSYNKMMGQLQHPQSCTGKFRKMLTIGTIFLHHHSKTLTDQILLFLPLCIWQTDGGNRNGPTGKQIFIYCFYVLAWRFVFEKLVISDGRSVHCVVASVTKRGLSSVMERTRTISPELFIRRGNVELWRDVCHLTAPATMSNPNHLLRFTR